MVDFWFIVQQDDICHTNKWTPWITHTQFMDNFFIVDHGLPGLYLEVILELIHTCFDTYKKHSSYDYGFVERNESKIERKKDSGTYG